MQVEGTSAQNRGEAQPGASRTAGFMNGTPAQPRRAASIAAMLIFFIPIIASNARLAAP